MIDSRPSSKASVVFKNAFGCVWAGIFCVLGLGACSSDEDSSSSDDGSGAGGSSGTSPGTGGSQVGHGGGGAPGGGGSSGGGSSGTGGSSGGSSCTGVATPTEGWVDISATVAGLGTGPMTSPILRCERDGDRFAVLALGSERDEVDSTVMRIEVPSGYAGPGSYSDGATVEVYHSDVGGYASGTASSCTVCVGADEQSGSFVCDGMPRWSGDGTMSVTAGSFVCPPVATPPSSMLGDSCLTYACFSPDETCANPDYRCAGGACVTENARVGVCTQDCTNEPCPNEWRCETVAGRPGRVCVSAAVCGNGVVEMGEECDEPPPTDHCAAGCSRCRNSERPGWVSLQATLDGDTMSVEDLPGGELGCFRTIGATIGTRVLTVGVPSCDPAHDFGVGFHANLVVGTTVYDGLTDITSGFCATIPGYGDNTVDRRHYCAFMSGPATDPEEMASVTITEVLCGGYGARGTANARVLYNRTSRGAGGEDVDPAHEGELLDVSVTFEIVAAPGP